MTLIESISQTFVARLVRKLMADRFGDHAVLIAWNALFSFFPITLVLATISGYTLGIAGVSDRKVEQVILSVIPKAAGSDQLIIAVREAGHHSGLFGVIALAGFLWGAFGLFGELEYSLGSLLGVPPRKFFAGRFMCLGMMLVFLIFVTLGVASSTVMDLISHLSNYRPDRTQAVLTTAGETVVGVVAGFGLFYAIYALVPNRRHYVGDIWPGALFAGIGFKLLTLLFPLYVSINPGFNQYGATFAFLFLLLSFFYLLGLLTVVGAEINALLDEDRKRAKRRTQA